MSVEIGNFGTTSDGRAVKAYHLRANGMSAVFLDYGAIVQSLCVPDRSGAMVDVAAGYDDMAQYENNDAYLGAAIGRFGNRIGGARFSLNGKTYILNANDGENQLHGGPTGFHARIRDAEWGEDYVRFSRLSPDGEENYPGNLTVSVTYTLTTDRALRIEYDAVSDQDTIVNLTNHSYFNLNGGGTALNHGLMINAERFTELGAGTLPNGNILPVEGTPLDFRTMKPLGRDIESEHPQIRAGCGYDHNYVLSSCHAATVRGDLSGIEMKVYTDMPGMQLYSGNFLTKRPGKGGRELAPHAALALETQLFPNAMNCYAFPSPVLRAGVQLHSVTSYVFGIYD